MRFNLNLATRTYIDHRLAHRVIIAVLIVLSLLFAWNVTRICRNIAELGRLRADIATFESKLATLPTGVSRQEYERTQASIRFYNRIIEQKSRNWLGLLNKLEKATPEGIAITSLVPDTKSGEIKLEARTRSFSQLRSYLEKLEESGHFREIQLQSHQNSASGEAAQGIQFCIAFRLAAP